LPPRAFAKVVADKAFAAGESAPLDHAGIDALAALYRQHIAREDKELQPMAARLLDDATPERVGRALRERRGIDAVIEGPGMSNRSA